MKRDDTKPNVDGQRVPNLFEFMQSSPLAKAIAEDGIEFDVDRPDDFGRTIDFGDDEEPI